mmetsp:Transcript_3790/g.14019  ORF Transcript_3790/g.14019 Transcript_3790/m.14019 type:complete len:315 (-) Transcript_3790:2247-3191(-)
MNSRAVTLDDSSCVVSVADSCCSCVVGVDDSRGSVVVVSVDDSCGSVVSVDSACPSPCPSARPSPPSGNRSFATLAAALGTSAEPAATKRAIKSGDAASKESLPAGERAIAHTAAARNEEETPVWVTETSASAPSELSLPSSRGVTGRTASRARRFMSSKDRGQLSELGVQRYMSAADVVSASETRQVGWHAPRSKLVNSEDMTFPWDARKRRCAPRNACSVSRRFCVSPSAAAASSSVFVCSKTRASTTAAATLAHPSSGPGVFVLSPTRFPGFPLLLPLHSVLAHVSSTDNFGSQIAFTRTGATNSRPSFRA